MADRIKGITIEIDGDATKLSKALAQVNRDLKQSQNTLKDVDKLLKLDPGNTALLQQKYKTLGDSIEQTKAKLQTLKNAQSQMEAQGKTGTAEYDALQREIVETEQKVKSLTKEFKNFGSVAAQQIAAVGEKMQAVGGKIEGVGQKLMPVSAALGAVGAVGVAKYAEVDKTMQLANKTMDNTAEEAELLSKAMKEAAANSTFGMSDAATATLNFARAGLDAREAASSLAPAMNLAAGEGGNLDTVSAGLVGTINGFHGEFREAGRYADVFAAACNNSALDVDSLANSMSVAAPVFSAAGYAVEDAALYLGVMANNSIDANVAANSLKTGLARLAKPAKEGSTALAKLGLETEDGRLAFFNLDGSMKDSVEVQKILHDSFAKLSEQEQISAASAIFGKNQMAPWLALINTAPEDVTALNNALASCAGTTDEMAEAMMSGFGGSIEKLKSSIDVAAVSLGEALAPTILAVANAVQSAVDWFNSLDASQQQMIVKIGLVVAAAGPVLLIVGKLTSGIGTLLTLAPKIVGAGSSLVGVIGRISGVAGGASSSLSAVGSAAGAAAGPATSAAGAVGTLTQNALGFIAIGAGILLAAAGLSLMAKAAIELGQAGLPAAAAMAGMVATIALLAAGAAALGPALTAGAVGLVAFGGAVALVGAGILAASSGVALIGSQMPVIAEHGSTAAEALGAIGASLLGLSAGSAAFALAAGAVAAALLAVGGGAGTAAASAVALTAGMAALTVAVGAGTVAASELSQGMIMLGASISAASTTGLAAMTLLGTGFQRMDDTAGRTLQSVDNNFHRTFGGILSYMGTVASQLKGIFNFSWSLPKIKLPHFRISGKFNMDPPQAPRFSVDWYRKAMDGGMILTSPTIFGAAGGRLLGGGEAGPEAVVGTASLQQMIQGAVTGASPDTSRLEAMLSQYLPYIPQLARMQVVTDTGALIGELTPGINDALGELAYMDKRTKL